MASALIGLTILFLFVFSALFLTLVNSLPDYITETQITIIFLFGIGSIMILFAYVVLKD